MRISRCWLLTALTLLVACADGDLQQAREAAAEHRFRAESFLAQGKYGDAMQELQGAETRQPGTTDTIVLMARTFSTIGALGRAEELYQQLLDVDRLSDAARADYARVLMQRGRVQKALALIGDRTALPAPLAGLQAQALLASGQTRLGLQRARQALADQPDDLDARIAFANAVFTESGMADDALPAALEALSEQDVPRGWLWRARLEQAGRDHEAAVASLSRVLAHLANEDMMTARRLEALKRMVSSLIALGRTDEALRYSTTIASSSAGELANRYEDALGLLRAGNLSGASEHFQEILSRSPGHSASAMALGMIALQQGEMQSARNYLDSAVENGAANVRAARYLVAVLLEQDELDEAERILDEAAADFPADAELTALAGLLAQRRGDTVRAAALFRATLEQQPGNVGAHISLGELALAAADAEQAERYFRQALVMRPAAAPALRGLVKVAELRGERAAGMDELRATLSELKQPHLWLLSAALAVEEDDLSAARRDLDTALRLDPDQKRAQAMRAVLDYREARQAFTGGDYVAAGRYVDAALRALPDQLGLLLLKASVATARGDRDAALAVAERVKRLGDSHHGYELAGDIHSQLDEQAAALQAYGAAWQRQRNSVLAGKYLAALRANGETGGEQLIADWAAAEPENREAWLSLASLQQAAGKPAQAAVSYQRIDALLPDNPAILNNLAWLYQEAGDDRALATAARAYALAPANPAITDTYGWLLVQAGDLSRGLSLLEQAAAAAPDSREILAHLQQARALAGETR